MTIFLLSKILVQYPDFLCFPLYLFWGYIPQGRYTPPALTAQVRGPHEKNQKPFFTAPLWAGSNPCGQPVPLL